MFAVCSNPVQITDAPFYDYNQPLYKDDEKPRYHSGVKSAFYPLISVSHGATLHLQLSLILYRYLNTFHNNVYTPS